MTITTKMHRVVADMRTWVKESDLPPQSGVALRAYEIAEQMERLAHDWADVAQADTGE